MNFLKVSPQLISAMSFIELFLGQHLEAFRKHRDFRAMLENLVGKVYLDSIPIDGKPGYLLIAALIHVQEMQFGEDGNEPIDYHDTVAFNEESPTALQPELEDLDQAAGILFNKKFVELDENDRDQVVRQVTGRGTFSLAEYLDEVISKL